MSIREIINRKSQINLFPFQYLLFDGVEKSYALSAGREIRIFVSPEKISDFEAHELARTIALRIEKELKYPGEIKITIIREQKIIEFAR